MHIRKGKCLKIIVVLFFLGSFSAFRSQSFVRRSSSQKDFHSSRAAKPNSLEQLNISLTDIWLKSLSIKITIRV